MDVFKPFDLTALRVGPAEMMDVRMIKPRRDGLLVSSCLPRKVLEGECSTGRPVPSLRLPSFP